ncbi:bacillithiol biosynthesis cysteine-adding enzyme BshC [Tenacibaculum adriaticum]|uniref:Putative cysteine ligase BshC n=1 Tax=Tenacibaculum adriaticum TaxID=413713 RepID=A0A5S5DLD6_9FLAO|nr:bacillithiol biosynthesis cysteine-adding enzyme BshC [Tenacibaculum adriaticum]TYP96743.1 bacillithiol biosynthesis cysteine-adding enzyme BshC [Tenacibaculum adriaticum]
MKITNIPFQKTGYFSKTMCDYLAKSDTINPFYHNFPDLEGFKNQIVLKEKSFSDSKRKVLVDVLQKQYVRVNASDKTAENIQFLLQENTFTITTGHQLNLFTGPLYFLYKIISAINLAEELSLNFPEKKIVPVYWMATEDHDFEEINFFNFKGKKVQWNSNQTGAVGRFSTEGLEVVLNELSKHLGTSKNAEYLKKLFTQGYLEHNNLAEATRYIANELFGEYGLVIIDADHRDLKNEFLPYAKEELLQQTSFKKVSKTNTEFEKEYKVQVNPREINLFYLTDTIRERIVLEDGVYKVNNTDISWSKSELLTHLDEVPERFSPNVIMRPLYEEVILPNLCYIGGGGELAYWMQLKSYFEATEVLFPILLLRNSVQVVSEKQQQKMDKLNVSTEEMFLKQNRLIKKKVKESSEIAVDFSKQKAFLQQQFNDLREVAKQTDVSFVGAVNAQEKKQLKGLENLEKRLMRAEKRKHKELVTRISELQNAIFPNQSLEERQRNFSEYYLEYGESFIKTLKNNLKPLELEFTVLTL